MIDDLAVQLYGDISLVYELLYGPSPPPVTEMGPLRKEVPLEFAPHQIPARTVLRVKAKPRNEELTKAHQVAQVRLEPNGFVIDFQALRTVSMIRVPLPASGSATVSPWIGTRFDEELELEPISSEGFRGVTGGVGGGPVTAQVYAFAEVQTERLRVVLSEPVSASDVDEFAGVVLPAPPSDLQLAIGGKVVWTHPGAIRPGQSTTVEEGAWSTGFETLVDLTGAVRAALESMDASTTRTVSVVLTTQSPGDIDLTASALEVTHQIDVQFPEGEARTVSFTEEGSRELLLPVPKDATGWTISQIAMIVEAPSGPDRVLPWVGPDPVPAEMTLDRERAVVAPLPRKELASLDTLVAVRMLLIPSAEGAEIAGLLYEDRDRERPGDPVEGVSLGPVALEPSPDDSPRWVTLPLVQPHKIAGRPLWVGVHLLRGRARWPLTAQAANAPAIHRGLPEGPFRALPPAPQELGIAGFGAIVRAAGAPPPSSNLPVGRLLAGGTELGAEIPVMRDGAPIGIEFPSGTNVEVVTSDDDQFSHIVLNVEAARAGDFRLRDVRVSYDV